MPDTELFLSLAEIAGVFVGFGALIAVRGGGASGALEVGYMRGVVSMAMVAVVAALAPVIIGRYGLAEHDVWSLSSGLALLGCLGMYAIQVRTPEYRANWARAGSASRWRWSEWIAAAAMVGYAIALLLAPAAVMLGVLPALEPALYATVVVLILLWSAWLLLELVFARPAAAR